MTQTARPHDTNGTERLSPPAGAGSGPGSGLAPSTGPGPADGDDRGGIAGDIRAVVEGTVSALGRAGTASVGGVADAVESAGRSLARRVVLRSVAEPRPVADRDRLARALADKPGVTLLASGTVAAAAARTLPKFRVFEFLGKRTPAFLLATAVPALVASVTRGADELGLVASHLALRAREQGVEPDPERLRRVAVQVVRGLPVDPTDEPSHGPLAVKWLRRAARAALPFTAGVATADPEGLASATVRVDPDILRAPA